MSEANQQQQQQQTRPLTKDQKDTARRLNMTEKEYAVQVDRGIKNGRLNPNNIP